MTLNAGAFQPANGPLPLPPRFHWLPEFAAAGRKRQGEQCRSRKGRNGRPTTSIVQQEPDGAGD